MCFRVSRFPSLPPLPPAHGATQVGGRSIDEFKLELRKVVGQEHASAAMRILWGLPPLPPGSSPVAPPPAAAADAGGAKTKAKAAPRQRAPPKSKAKGGAAAAPEAAVSPVAAPAPGGAEGAAAGAAGGSVRDHLRDDAASAAGIDMAAETAALLPAGAEADVALGRARLLVSREEWVAATRQRLQQRLTGDNATCAALRAHGVCGLSPGAAAALTAAVVDRMTAVLEGVRAQRDWRAGRGSGVGAGPPGAVVTTARPQLELSRHNKDASLAEANRAAKQREAYLAAEEAALKRKRAAAGADGPVSAEDAERAAKIARMRAEDEGRFAADASAGALRAALGGNAASVHDRWAQMQSAQDRGEDPLAAAAAMRAAAAAAAAAVAPAPAVRAAARTVSLRDCVAWLRRDGRASPRLLGAAAERLRRAEQPGVNAAATPATASLLGPLTPRWL